MKKKAAMKISPFQVIKTFTRFSTSQRLEHLVLIISILILLITGLPQKYRSISISRFILSTPDSINYIQTIHHIGAIILIFLAIYHIGKNLTELSKKRISAEIFVNNHDTRDAWNMLRYLFFVTNEKPKFGKYNFEQKFTYWFIFFGIGIMGVSGLILWFPESISRIVSGGIIPAARLSHSSESIVLLIFISVWHFYHVHIERLNLSIFTGWISEKEMREYHTLEYENITNVQVANNDTRD